jgi:hypothetical protein
MRRLVGRLMIALAAIGSLLFAALVGSAAYTHHKARMLIEDLRRLDTVSNPTALLASLTQKHLDQSTGEECQSDVCQYGFLISNRALSRFHLVPLTEMRTTVTLYRNSLVAVSVDYTSAVFKENSPIVGVQEDFCGDRTDIKCDHFGIDPHGRNVTQTWKGSVEFGQLATIEQKQKAWALNLDCLTAIHGCKNISRLLPTIWKLTSPNAVSSRVRSSADSIAESTEPLPE